MDIRTEIVQRVMMALEGKADDGITSLVHDTLVMQLNAYEVLERCTEGRAGRQCGGAAEKVPGNKACGGNR